MSHGTPFRREDPVDAAIARGDFDDLALAGKPLHLPSRHDPDWWIKQRIDEDDVDRDALLPVVMLLRREHDRRADTLASLTTEQEVREYAADYTRRVRDDRLRNPLARMLAPEMDGDETVERWRGLRAPEPVERSQSEPAEREDQPRRRWWPFPRRRGNGRARSSLDEPEMAQDLAAYREAKASDDGQRVSLEELRRDLKA